MAGYTSLKAKVKISSKLSICYTKATMNALHVLSTAASLVQDKKEGDSPHGLYFFMTVKCDKTGFVITVSNMPVDESLETF